MLLWIGNPCSTGISASLPCGGIDLLQPWLSTHVLVLLHCLSLAPVHCSAEGTCFLFLLVLKRSASGVGQLEGEEELALNTRYGNTHGITGRGPKGSLPVLRAFSVLFREQHLLRKELILSDIKGHRGTDVWVCFDASSTALTKSQPSLPSLPPCQSQGCFSCSTVLLAPVILYCLM